jgi:hypothetical protein
MYELDGLIITLDAGARLEHPGRLGPGKCSACFAPTFCRTPPSQVLYQ